jgi:hypothetical protein
MHIFTYMHTVKPHWQVELVHSLMLALSLNTDKALEIVKQDKLIEVFAVTAATSPSAYVRSAIFELLTVSTAATSTRVLVVLLGFTSIICQKTLVYYAVFKTADALHLSV